MAYKYGVQVMAQLIPLLKQQNATVIQQFDLHISQIDLQCDLIFYVNIYDR